MGAVILDVTRPLVHAGRRRSRGLVALDAADRHRTHNPAPEFNAVWQRNRTDLETLIAARQTDASSELHEEPA